jgi:hypothetical protein
VHSVCQVCRENEAKTHRTCPGKTMCEPCETTRLKQSAKKATKSKRTAGKRKAQRALAQSLVPRSWTVREDGVKTSLCSSCHAGRPHHSFADQVTKCCYFCVTKKRHSAKRVKLQVKAEDDTIPARAASPISGTPLLLSAANASSALLGATASSAADATHASAPRVDHMSLCGSCNKKSSPKDVNMCTGCYNVVYCDSACQVAHWEEHQADCGARIFTGTEQQCLKFINVTLADSEQFAFVRQRDSSLRKDFRCHCASVKKSD